MPIDKKNIYDQIQDSVMHLNLSESEKNDFLRKLLALKEQKINLMITGATGSGKSSTINALFNAEKAKVGVTADPETMSIEKYELDNLILWDTPGLGDGREADNRHAKAIIDKLNEVDSNNKPLIDVVLVILDAGSRDLGTSYELINNVIIPNLGDEKQNRILVALNQCDNAMKGRHWNFDENCPDEVLTKFLDEKVESVRNRILEATGVNIEPIYYSAGYKEAGELQNPPYNLTKLLSYIVKYTPKEKRLNIVSNLNKNPDMWKDNDNLKDYSKEVHSSMMETIRSCAKVGGEIGRTFGGSIGEVIGTFIGGAVGFICSIFD